MNSTLLNIFVESAQSIFQQVTSIPLHLKDLQTCENGQRIQAHVAAILSFTGSWKGQLVLVMEEIMGMKIASAIMMGMPVETFDEVAESGVAEITNMVGGEAARRMVEIGLSCDMSVPSIIRGNDMEIAFFPKIPRQLASFSSDWGPLQVMIRMEPKT
jgi:chemotaxis protein CheX